MLRTVIFFILGVTFSAASISEVEETTTYGVSQTYGNPNYHGDVGSGMPRSNGLGGGPSGTQLAMKMAAEKAAKEAEKRAKCPFKSQAMSSAASTKETCEYNAIVKFNAAALACPTVTKAVVQIDVSRGVNVGVDAALKKFGINAGAVAGFVVSGTLEFSPQASCRLNHEDTRNADMKICSNDFNKVERAFADCPQ